MNSRKSILAIFFISILSYVIPYFINWGYSGRFDFDHFEVFYQILKWWHEIGDYSVTWNPYSCGGATLVGDPQMPLFHPTTLIYLLFTPANGLKITVIFWATLGFIFMFLFAKEHELDNSHSSIAASVWILNGYFASHTSLMHLAHFAQFIFPLLLLINIKYIKTRNIKYLLLLPPALLLSIVGSPHYIWFCLPFVCIHLFLELMFRKISIKYLYLYILFIGVGLGMSSFYLIPAYFWQIDFPKNAVNEFVRPWYLIISMLYPGKVTFFERNGRTPHEFIFFIGPILLYFFAKSFKFRKEIKSFSPFIIIITISFLMGWGSFKALGSPIPSLLDIVKLIPGFQAAQVPTRFWLPALFFIIILAISTLKRKNFSNKTIFLLYFFIITPLLGYNLYAQLRLFGIKPSERNNLIYKDMPYKKSNEFYQKNYSGYMMELLKPNTGIKNCYQGIYIPTAFDIKTDHGILLKGPKETSIEIVKWDEINIKVPDHKNTLIKLNMNHHNNWNSYGCAKIVSKFHEPLMIAFPQECTEVKIKYIDPYWKKGIIISLIFTFIWILIAVGIIKKINFSQ